MSTIPLQATGKITIVVNRTAIGSYIGGRYVDGTVTSIPIEANVQPVNAKELLNLPEAQRSRDVIKIYTSFELKAAREGVVSTKADLIVYDGSTWQVHSSDTYKMGILNHTKALAFKLDIL